VLKRFFYQAYFNRDSFINALEKRYSKTLSYSDCQFGVISFKYNLNIDLLIVRFYFRMLLLKNRAIFTQLRLNSKKKWKKRSFQNKIIRK